MNGRSWHTLQGCLARRVGSTFTAVIFTAFSGYSFAQEDISLYPILPHDCRHNSDYPAAALRDEASGITVALVTIDKWGNSKQIKILSPAGPTRSHKSLDISSKYSLENCRHKLDKPTQGDEYFIAIHAWQIDRGLNRHEEVDLNKWEYFGRNTLNEATKIQIPFTKKPESIQCGISIDWGDGTSSRLRVGERFELKPPFQLSHQYSREGFYNIRILGESLVRGLNSVSACSIDLQRKIYVFDQSKVDLLQSARKKQNDERETMLAAAREKAIEEERRKEEARPQEEAKRERESEERRLAGARSLVDAAAQRRKLIDEALQKGRQFAQSVQNRWIISQSTDLMLNREVTEARSSIQVGQARIDASLSCNTRSLNLKLVIFGGSFPVEISTATDRSFGSPTLVTTRKVRGRQRLNEEFSEIRWHGSNEFANVADIYFGDKSPDGYILYGPNKILYGGMFEIATNHGPAIIKLPLFDPKIQQFISRCPISSYERCVHEGLKAGEPFFSEKFRVMKEDELRRQCLGR
jgi:hypothetical protein